MRQRIVAGNWKMNASTTQVDTLISGIVSNLGDCQTNVIVCPPFPYLSQVSNALKNSDLNLGAQDLNINKSGAFTGEVSADMLKDFSTTYVIVGHSERRALYNEDNALVAQKVQVALDNNLTPLLCLGEQLEERENGTTEAIVKAQLDTVIDLVGIKAFKNIIIAYEPVWAIGTGKVATPAQAQDTHAFIRSELNQKDATIAQNCAILYGGSVNGDNAKELFSCADIDGGLIGGASLDAESFLKIAKA
jgi:triosephosphate isomerase